MTENRQTYLTEPDLAERWRMTSSALRNQRSRGRGPRFVKLGPHGRVRYPLDEVLRYERLHTRP